MAFDTGAPTMPWWYPVLELSFRWGTPPWEFAGGSPLAWYNRGRLLMREEARQNRKNKRVKQWPKS